MSTLRDRIGLLIAVGDEVIFTHNDGAADRLYTGKVTFVDDFNLEVLYDDETAYFRYGSDVINLSTIKENMPEEFV